MTETQERIEKSTSDQLVEVLARLSTDQIRFVVARQEFSTDKEAADAVGVKANTVYGWKATAPIDDAVRLMAHDGLVTAQIIRRRALAKAMSVKVKGLDSENEIVAQRSSTEIIEWEMGRATQPTTVKADIDMKLLEWPNGEITTTP